MPSYTNVFGGTVVYSAEVSYRAFTLSANVELSWPTELATNTNVVSSIMDVTPSGAGFEVAMPAANLASVGETALFFNVGASSFTVTDNSGNTIQTIAPGEAWQIYMTSNTTVDGSWRPIQYGAGTSSVSASALAGAGIKAITTTLNQSTPTTLLSADYTLTSVDRARVLVWNGGAGTFTMPSAAVAGNDWFFEVRNSGTGGLTIAPTGGELINGQASLIFNPGDSARIITDGLNFYTIGFGQNATFAFDFVSISLTGQPSPYTLAGTDLNRIAYQFSGTLTANMEIIVPNTVQQYWVRNTTTGAYTLTVKTAAGTGVVVVQNGAAIVYCDGTNVVEADTNNLSSPIAISQGGTGATTAGTALINLGGTSLGIGVFTAVNSAVARAALGAAGSGANADITSLSGLTTPLSAPQGGTGYSSYTNGQMLIGNTTTGQLSKATLTAGTGVTVTNAPGSVTIAATGPDTFPSAGIVYSTGSAWGASYTTSGTGTQLALTASPTFTGTPAAPTAAAGTSTTQIATTAFVTATAFSSVLPGQTGNAGKFVTTDGVNASWSYVPLTSGVTGTLPVGNGGTGATTLTGYVKGNGASAMTASATVPVGDLSGTLPIAQGGTGATDAGTARTNLSAASSGANSDITSLTGLTTALSVGQGGTGSTSLTLNNVLLGNGTSALQTVAPGASGNVLTSNGTSWISAAISSASVQAFTSSGTWTKPANAQFVLVEVWGAGGGGGRPAANAANPAGAGGGGGAYNYDIFLASQLNASVSVIVGAGGTGATVTGSAGLTGGSTSFGSHVFAYGGGGGAGNATGAAFNTGGGGGGLYSNGGTGTGGGPYISNAVAGSIMTTQVSGGGQGGGSFTNGATTLADATGSFSTFGGGGGAGANNIYLGNGGTSQFGGGGGGHGGTSTAGGSSNVRSATQGGGLTPVNIVSGPVPAAYYGAAGGGQIPNYGPTALTADFLQGGGGGSPASTAVLATGIVAANNGGQVAILGIANPGSGNSLVALVSSDGLATYTPYYLGKRSYNSSNGIIYDGSRYVIATLISSTVNTQNRSVVTTTDFVNFTEYGLNGIPPSVTATGTGRLLHYINGKYFLCTTSGLYYSNDLSYWIDADTSSSANIFDMAYDGTYYYALAASTVLRSSDLITWTTYTPGVSASAVCIAASPTTIVVTASATNARYSTDAGVTWANLPTIGLGAGRAVSYFAATGDWILGNSSNQVYYSTTPTVSWTLSATATLPSTSTAIVYNGTRYALGQASTTAGAKTSTTAAGTFTDQAMTALQTAASPGGNGGIAGGGGGGAGSSTTTTNGGNGGNGYCRVYTW